MLLTEQLYFNINKNVIKEIFLYAKNCLLGDLSFTLAHFSNLDISFLNSYKVKSKNLPHKPKIFIFQENDFIESENNKKVKIEVSFEKIGNFYAVIIKVSPTHYVLKINEHYIFDNIELIKVASKNVAKKYVDELLKSLYKTIYHELTHIAQHIDKKNKANIPFYPLQIAKHNDKKYYLQQHEFATYLSNAYASIKRITNSGRNKLNSKEFDLFCKGVQVRGKSDAFMKELYKDFVKQSKLNYDYDFDKDRWVIAKDRLYNLCINKYLNRD